MGWMTWWLWRGACTRSHPELGRENPQRPWYCVLRRGRVGRRQVFQPIRFSFFGAGWSSPVARQAHNLKAAGSNPAPATPSFTSKKRVFRGFPSKKRRHTFLSNESKNRPIAPKSKKKRAPNVHQNHCFFANHFPDSSTVSSRANSKLSFEQSWAAEMSPSMGTFRQGNQACVLVPPPRLAVGALS